MSFGLPKIILVQQNTQYPNPTPHGNPNTNTHSAFFQLLQQRLNPLINPTLTYITSYISKGRVNERVKPLLEELEKSGVCVGVRVSMGGRVRVLCVLLDEYNFW